ncbi:MAG: hypothetical protein H0W88_09220 [Parachlamydiaceae bacterium]|nr:hypothetical protein [Parachlamydiaceae bacterium]
MVQVSTLLKDNDLIIKDQNQQKSFVYRCINLGTHSEMLKGSNVKISKNDLKIAFIAQCILVTITEVMLIGASLIIANQTGINYWHFSKIGFFLGLSAGLYNGSKSGKTPILEEIKKKSNIYACYNTKYKLLQPLKEMKNGFLNLGVTMLLFNTIPRYAYFDATIHSMAITYNIGTASVFASRAIKKMLISRTLPTRSMVAERQLMQRTM